MKTRTVRHKIAAVSSLLAGALLLASCAGDESGGGSASGDGPAGEGVEHVGDITLGLAPDASFANILAAVDRGFFEAHGLTPTVKNFSSGGDATQAASTGDIDLSSVGQYAALLSAANGAQINLLARVNSSGNQVGIVTSESNQSIDDLDGKVVGMQQGSTSVLYSHILQRDTGVSFDIEYIGTDQTLAAFARGQIDAYISWQPNLDRGVEAVEGSHILAFSGDDGVMPLVSSLMASQQLLEQPEIAEAALRAIAEASEWANDNKDELGEMMAERFNAPVELMKANVNVFDYNFGFDEAAQLQYENARDFIDETEGVTVDLDEILLTDLLEAARPDLVSK